jgi:hypothetical protein
MKSPVTATLVALFAFSGISGALESSAHAKDKTKGNRQETAVVQEPAASTAEFQNVTGDFGVTFESPHYLIQVEYARTPRPGHYGGSGGGRNGGRPRYTYVWVTIAESTDLEEAEFIYALFNLAWEQGVLHEVAPDLPYLDFPRRVQMITEYREYEPVFSAE